MSDDNQIFTQMRDNKIKNLRENLSLLLTTEITPKKIDISENI